MKVFYIVSIVLFLTATAQGQSSDPKPSAVKIIKFYPNPAITQITFDFEKGFEKGYSFQVFNFVGKKVTDLNNVNARTVVNVTDFYRGVYIFQLKDKSGKVIDTGKFQVVH
ncbi:MAG: hypothetical protein RLZZ316_1072 [Bacteroidota bacterium]